MSTHSFFAQYFANKRRGFTLTEIAIVLGIIGLILGAIWIAASAVYMSMSTSKAKSELLQITQGIRSIYGDQVLVDTANAVDLTPALIAAKILPSDSIVNASTVNGPWPGSSIEIYSSQNPYTGVVGDSFEVVFANIPMAACIALAVGSVGQNANESLVGLEFNQSDSGAEYITPDGTIPSITVLTAASACRSPTASMGFVYSLQPGEVSQYQ